MNSRTVVAPNFGPQFKRTDLGPAESALLLILPDSTQIAQELTFDLIGPGSLTLGPPGTHYTAPLVAATATVVVSAPLLRAPMSKTFKTWLPNHISFTTDGEVLMDDGSAGAVMVLNATLHAFDDAGNEHPVSFAAIEVTDEPAHPEDVQGYFATLPLPADFDSEPLGSFARVDAFNKLTLVHIAALDGQLFQPPPAWTRGAFIYRMPWVYRFLHDPNGTRHPLTIVGREIQIDGPESPRGAGTVTIVQDSACVSRAPNNFFFTCN